MKHELARGRGRYRRACALALCLGLAGVAVHAADDTSVKTGEGGRLLRYSSTQRWVELSPEERQSYERLRDHPLPAAASLDAGVQACRRALEALGYGSVEADAEFGLVLAYRHESLIGDARKSLRGLWMLKLPMPAKPDHQSTEIRISLRRPDADPGLQLRARIVSTVWDSHGDASTRIDADAAHYQELFRHIEQALAAP